MVTYETRISSGTASLLIASQANRGKYVTVTGDLDSGRFRLAPIFGLHPIAHLAADVSHPIIYVPKPRLQMKRILVCVHTSQGWGQWSKPKRPANTKASRIERATQTLAAMGFDASIDVRYGIAGREIIDEMHRAEYDLIALDAEAPRTDLATFLTPNITHEVARAADRPLLIFATNPKYPVISATSPCQG